MASSSTSSYIFTNVYEDGEEGGELLLTGLSKYTRYSIVIQSFNQVGPGPLSEPILTQTLEDGKYYYKIILHLHNVPLM